MTKEKVWVEAEDVKPGHRLVMFFTCRKGFLVNIQKEIFKIIR
mgnify:CR=1 FL=1